MRRRRGLSTEEARLWAGVARSAIPLKGRSYPPLPPEIRVEKPAAPAKPAAAKPNAVLAPVRPAPEPAARLSQHAIEKPTRRKLAKGRLAIDARIDLHEMTQQRAHDALVSFLRQAQAMGLRHVLVITGRGGTAGSAFGSRGVLRRVVPQWFAGPEFRPLVSGFDSAERHHGGDGALYVRVRRPR
ncbi:DNA mismatch repair protein MutS [Aurantimonas aggregata]|uniref:DNA mismatch repair protein MutS n=1 Tax=Aurantimonas aggregata TaxID=2047720 RepID=A0A6L9MLI2_9HYPH|nr:Smr/MutS family protein [Aurantimonas aggregata]NDV88398.1 DNA mismatch repair protein MutS [Aurantimonas aggregata]